MNMQAPYKLVKDATIRHERFGALIYRYDNRRLYFIHSVDVADFIMTLDGRLSLEAAVSRFLADRHFPAPHGDTLVRTVKNLETMGIVNAMPAA